MFAKHLLLFAVILHGSWWIARADISIVAQPAATKANLTCEEFCEISFHGRGNTVDSSATALPDPAGDHHRMSARRTVTDWMRHKDFRAFMNEEYLRRSSIVFGLAQLANENYLSSTCFRHLKEIEKAVLRKDVWAMKVLDSSGIKEAGFLWGHNYWLGSQQGCESLQKPIYITLSKHYERTMKSELINELAPFDMAYRLIFLKHHSPWQVEVKFMTERIIHVGLCLPIVCSTSEIANMTQTYLEDNVFEESTIYEMHPQVVRVKDFKVNENFINKKSVKLVGAILGFTILMFIIASCMEDGGCVKQMKSKSIWAISQEDTQDKESLGQVWYPLPYERSLLQRVIKCFDVVDNCKSLFTVKESTNAIPVIDGLRSISCIWILFFHVAWYMYFTVDNKPFLVSYGERVFFQYVSTAPLLVDVFFTISGFLVTFNFMKNENNLKRVQERTFLQNLKELAKIVLHRYLRLAPLYLVLTGMVEIFTSYVEDVSIFHLHEKYDQTCAKYWWRNIFFIQNLFQQEELCLNWTWSLACEMQFYVVASGLLFLYAKYPQTVRNIFYVGLTSSIVWTYIVGCKTKYQLSFDSAYNTGTDVYINPFIRVMPYYIGVGGGWLLAATKGDFKINPIIEKSIWNVAIVVFFACIYSTIKRDMSTIATMTLLVVGRLLFAISVCWMIIGSAAGRGVWWSRCLEWKGFQHFNRLSYAIYLLNPFVIGIVFSLSSTSTHADPILLAVLTSGFVVIVYFCSIVFSLSFEIPYCNLSSQLLRKKLKLA